MRELKQMKLKFSRKGIITWGMIEFFMHMVKCGSKGITSWGGQWGTFLNSSPNFAILFCVCEFSLFEIFRDICRFLPYVGWVTIIMTEKPYIKVNF
jgi:hypothetical protein